jgi:hypothetical protein
VSVLSGCERLPQVRTAADRDDTARILHDREVAREFRRED